MVIEAIRIPESRNLVHRSWDCQSLSLASYLFYLPLSLSFDVIRSALDMLLRAFRICCAIQRLCKKMRHSYRKIRDLRQLLFCVWTSVLRFLWHFCRSLSLLHFPAPGILCFFPPAFFCAVAPLPSFFSFRPDSWQCKFTNPLMTTDVYLLRIGAIFDFSYLHGLWANITLNPDSCVVENVKIKFTLIRRKSIQT